MHSAFSPLPERRKAARFGRGRPRAGGNAAENGRGWAALSALTLGSRHSRLYQQPARSSRRCPMARRRDGAPPRRRACFAACGRHTAGDPRSFRAVPTLLRRRFALRPEPARTGRRQARDWLRRGGAPRRRRRVRPTGSRRRGMRGSRLQQSLFRAAARLAQALHHRGLPAGLSAHPRNLIPTGEALMRFLSRGICGLALAVVVSFCVLEHVSPRIPPGDAVHATGRLPRRRQRGHAEARRRHAAARHSGARRPAPASRVRRPGVRGSP